MLNLVKKLFKTDQIILLAVGAATTFLMGWLFVQQPLFISLLDLKVYDEFMRSYHDSNATDVPVVIDLDEKSLAEIGQWPWPRYRVAMLLKNLQAYGAVSVATDIIFVEPDNTSPNLIKRNLLKEFKLNVTMQGLPAALGDNDKLLAQNLKTGPFVLGIDFKDASPVANEDDQKAERDCILKPINVAVHAPAGAPSPHELILSPDDAICPIPELAEAAPQNGFITIASDKDGLFRRVPLLISWNEKFYPSLALASLMQGMNIKSVLLKITEFGVESIKVGPLIIPTDRQGKMPINYRGSSHTFKYISASDVINGRLAPGALAGKIAFIGTSASGLKDLRPTPLDPGYPGVEAHATIVDNILSEQYIRIPDWTVAAQLGSIVFVGLLTTCLLMWAKAAWLTLPLIGVGCGIYFGTIYIYTDYDIYLSPMYALINLTISFTVLTMIKFWREEQAKKFIHGAFAHYLAPSVITQIMDDPDSLSLEGQEKEITIQFSDVRSFTSLSEKLTPTQVTDLLSDYLTPMTRIITDHQGTLDKFIGDAVMAFWNAPLDVENHQEKSLVAALAQMDKLEELNEVFIDKFGFTIAVGIGIHSGPVRVGNMGSADLFDYTLIGDNVNLASRLEGLTKFYGQRLVVSQTIVDACEGKFHFRVLDSVRVKGKEKPITIYTAYTLEQAEARKEELRLFEKAHDMYLNMQFSEAQKLFDELHAMDAEPLLYQLYIERCQSLQEDHPGDDWDGVFTHKTK